MTVFLCGDVMTGRGVDQILPHPNEPDLHEPYVQDAREYVALAERANGPIPRPADPAYVWGDALATLGRVQPDARVVNLETSITASDQFWPGKDIHYRMHPANIGCLHALAPEVCVLANNHVLDYGYRGLEETLASLSAAGIRAVGAGATLEDAERPAVVDLGDGRRVLVLAIGFESSGIPPVWAARADARGVAWLAEPSDAAADALLDRVRRLRQPGDVVIASVHWGSNWGYAVPPAHVRFAHRLLDGGVDPLHGHSSHHPRAIEIYRDRLALYGCGDFLDDYEGLSGYERYRDDLVLMYFARLDAASGRLESLAMTPLRIARMRLNGATPDEARWLHDSVRQASAAFGTDLDLDASGTLHVRQLSGRRA